jgi:quinol monooxygenase YgiN
VIIVHGTIPVRPERRDEALRLARVMTVATQQEPGCISYDFYVGLTDPNTLVLFQEWADMDSLMAHFQTEHMETFLSQLPEVLAGEITTRRYAVQSMEAGTDEEPSPPPVIH